MRKLLGALLVILLITSGCSSTNNKKGESEKTEEKESDFDKQFSEVKKKVELAKTVKATTAHSGSFKDASNPMIFNETGNIEFTIGDKYDDILSNVNLTILGEDNVVYETLPLTIAYKNGERSIEGELAGAYLFGNYPNKLYEYLTYDGVISHSNEDDNNTYKFKGTNGNNLEIEINKDYEFVSIKSTYSDDEKDYSLTLANFEYNYKVLDKEDNQASKEENNNSIESSENDEEEANNTSSQGSVVSNNSSSDNTTSGNTSNNTQLPIPVEPEQPNIPPVACPGGMDPSLPCNWTPNSIGNTGLIFDTENALYAYAESKGWAGNTYQVLCLNYNDGSVKYSINKY